MIISLVTTSRTERYRRFELDIITDFDDLAQPICDTRIRRFGRL